MIRPNLNTGGGDYEKNHLHHMMQYIYVADNWEKLISLSCHHTFYEDGICKDFSFTPSMETDLALKNLKCIFRSQPNGFTILGHSEKSLKLFQSPVLKVEKFTFYINQNNGKFINFSNLPFTSFGQLYYFNNLTENKEKGSDAKLLHGQEYLYPKEDEFCAWRPKRFQVRVEQGKKIDLEVIDVFGKKVKLEDLPEKAPTRLIPLNLDSHSPGKYTLKTKQGDVPIITSKKRLERYWGVIDIYLEAAPKGNQIIVKNQFTPQEYSIKIERRSTHWRYFLIDQNNKKEQPKFSNPKVSTNGTELEFTNPEFIELSNGHQAAMIESKKPLPLSEMISNKDKLNLKIKKNGKWVSKPLKLPKPTIDLIKPDRETNKIYSETFVYL